MHGLNGKELDLGYEFEYHNVKILGVMETKKKGRGELLLEGGSFLVFSRLEKEKTAAAGVGCIIHRSSIRNTQK